MYSCLFRSLVFNLLFFSSFSISAAIITLQNGDRLHAIVKKKTDTELHIENVNLGTFAIPYENIVTINYEGKAVPGKNSAVTPFVDKGLFYSGFFRNWKRTLEVGINGAAGVSDNSKFRSAFEMRYKDYKDRWHFSMFYLLTEENKETEENRLTANLIRDWLIPDSKWFYFSKLGYD